MLKYVLSPNLEISLVCFKSQTWKNNNNNNMDIQSSLLYHYDNFPQMPHTKKAST